MAELAEEADEPQSLVCHQDEEEDETDELVEEPENRLANQGAEPLEAELELTALLEPPYNAERKTSSAKTGWLALAEDTAEPPPQVLLENHESVDELIAACDPKPAELDAALTYDAFKLSNTGSEVCHKSDALALIDDTANTKNVLPSTFLVILLFVPSSGIGLLLKDQYGAVRFLLRATTAQLANCNPQNHLRA